MEQSGRSYWEEFLGIESSEKPAAETVVRQVVKRNGRLEKYDRWKIAGAIGKAVRAVLKKEDLDFVEELTSQVEERLREVMSERHPNSVPAIEEIQDLVETVLMENKHFDIAKAYIIYRAKHETIRDTRKLTLDISSTMDGYLSQSDWRVN